MKVPLESRADEGEEPPLSRASAQFIASETGEGEGTPAREPWGWTRRQRLGLGMLVGVLLMVLMVQYMRRPYRLREGEGVVVREGKVVTLPQRIDPNVADERELSRVPHIGEALAGRIVKWREERKGTTPDGVVFRQLEDLDKVPGVGKKLVGEMGPYLMFPEGEKGP